MESVAIETLQQVAGGVKQDPMDPDVQLLVGTGHVRIQESKHGVIPQLTGTGREELRQARARRQRVLVPGRIVRFHLNRATWRTALVVGVDEESAAGDHRVNLVVFFARPDDAAMDLLRESPASHERLNALQAFVGYVPQAGPSTPMTWSWPPLGRE